MSYFYSRSLLTLIFLAISTVSFSQYKSFGDVTFSDFDDYDRSYDSTASAVKLFDVAKVWFDGETTVMMDRHVRIKILNESGYNFGDVELLYNKELNQGIRKIKALTHVNNGNTIELKEMDDEIFDNRLRNSLYTKKFTMPQLSPGVIIEYTYQMNMGNPFYLPDWQFHNEIPVKYSAVEYKIPWRFNYMFIFKGVDTTYTSSSERYNSPSGGGYFVNISKENMPPVENLPYMNSREDFISEVYTQLNYVLRDGGGKINYFKDWDNVAEEIRSHPDIGKQKLNREMKNKVKELVAGMESPLQKMQTIYEYISETIVWNGLHQLFSEKGVRKTFDEQSGSSGDINILLYKMLEEADLQVNYGLTSTRTHGSVLANYPIINQFNHIIIVAEIDGRAYILDASEGKRPFFLPPVKNLYQLVLVIDRKDLGWIEVKPSIHSYQKSNLRYTFDDSGTAHATFDNESTGYFSQLMRQNLKSSGKDEFSKGVLEGLEELEIDSVTVHGDDFNEKKLNYTIDFSFNILEDGAPIDIIYFNPLQFMRKTESPFTQPTRDFPVYFPFPYQEGTRVTIELPEGYKVDELPEDSINSLPENAGVYNYFVHSTDSTVVVSTNMEINKVLFSKEEYESLRNMFATIVESHSRAIVLKKSGEY